MNKHKNAYMETYDKEMIEEMLPRYCSGEATVEQCRKVEEWIEQSEENYLTVKQMHIINQVIDTVQMESKVNTEKALVSVRRKISNERSHVTWFTRIQQVAAILAIPLLFFFFQNLVPTRTNTEKAQMIEVKTNPGIITTIDLPDGSRVYLNSESSLTYPSFFSKDKREVHLKGEAFFEVQKNIECQFVVSAPNHTQIEVLGTSFNVEAYDKDPFITTTLVEGAVRFAYLKSKQQTAVRMKPGQKLIYNPSASQVELIETSGETETAWRNGKIVFQATLLPEALHMLEKRFNVTFILSNNHLRKEAFNGSFTNQRLERILETFKVSSNINWRYIDTRNPANERTKIEIY